MRVLLLVSVASILFTLSACTAAKSRDKAQADPLSPTAYPQIAALDGLGKYIAFSSPAISVTGDGELAVTVPIRLANGEQRGIEYKFEFFNDDGSPVQPAQDWQYMNLPQKTQRYAKGHAKTTRIKQWRLLLRDAKE